MKVDYVDIVEAAYRVETDEQSWLRDLVRTSRAAVVAGSDAWALVYELGEAPTAKITRLELESGSSGAVSGVVARLLAKSPLEPGPSFGTRACGLASDVAGRDAEALRDFFHEHRVADVIGVNAMDPNGRGVFLGINLESRARLRPAERSLFTRIAAHVAAAHRLRTRLAGTGGSAPGSLDGVEAMLENTGALVHAEPRAASESARRELRTAVGSLERARGGLRNKSPAAALAAWKGLVSGRWTLLDHFARDGKRYVVARRNDPDRPDFELLTERERQVVAFAVLGHANKLTAYELGIATSTVGVLLSRAMAKLGCPNRKALRQLTERHGFARGDADVDPEKPT